MRILIFRRTGCQLISILKIYCCWNKFDRMKVLSVYLSLLICPSWPFLWVWHWHLKWKKHVNSSEVKTAVCRGCGKKMHGAAFCFPSNFKERTLTYHLFTEQGSSNWSVKNPIKLGGRTEKHASATVLNQIVTILFLQKDPWLVPCVM